MITREMIKKGFENGIISIEDDYAGCMGICCKIGENAFYFAGPKDVDLGYIYTRYDNRYDFQYAQRC